jgi:hypothetical protein
LNRGWLSLACWAVTFVGYDMLWLSLQHRIDVSPSERHKMLAMVLIARSVAGMDTSYRLYVDIHPQRGHRYRGPDPAVVASLPRSKGGDVDRIAR